LGYRFSDPDLRDKTQFPTFYQIDPHGTGLGWLFRGQRAVTISDFEVTLAQNDICIHFVKQILPRISILNILHRDQVYMLLTILNSDAQVGGCKGEQSGERSILAQRVIPSLSLWFGHCREGTIMLDAFELLRQRLLISDVAHCDPCPKDEYPNKEKNHCIVKKMHFLAYQDTLGYTMTGLPLLLLLLFFWLLPPTSPTSARRSQTRYGLPKHLKIEEHYYRPGDLIIGGNLPLGVFAEAPTLDFKMDPLHSVMALNPLGETEEFILPSSGLTPSNFLSTRVNPAAPWNWVGLMPTESENGEHFVSTMMPMLKEKELKADIIVFFGVSGIIAVFQWVLQYHVAYKRRSFQHVWILTSSWKHSIMAAFDVWQSLKLLHGSLHFREHSGDISEFSHFLLSLDPLNPQGDMFLPHVGVKKCTGNENLQNIPNKYSLFQTTMIGESCNIYNAVYVLAHALHTIYGPGT
ncbi:hypothetical protein E2320_022161, partial [Naja naja]